MLSQDVSLHWPWFVELCRERKIKLLFLLRRNALNMLVSRRTNQNDKLRTKESPAYRHHAHPSDDERLKEVRSQTVALAPDTVVADLDDIKRKWEELDTLRLYAMARGVPAARLVYEDIDEDHALFENITDYVFCRPK